MTSYFHPLLCVYTLIRAGVWPWLSKGSLRINTKAIHPTTFFSLVNRFYDLLLPLHVAHTRSLEKGYGRGRWKGFERAIVLDGPPLKPAPVKSKSSAVDHPTGMFFGEAHF